VLSEEASRKALRLHTTRIVQRNICFSLPAPLEIPIGLTMTDDVKGSHRVYLSCLNTKGRCGQRPFLSLSLEIIHERSAALRFSRAADLPAGEKGHQDAQTPPSPRAGEGSRGDEEQTRTGMQKTPHLSQELRP
jgi:hypothetical protein